jgi:tetratricopeptide (TPR) repeat protein
VPGTPELILTRDGLVVGRASGDWNWLVGRQLADVLLKTPNDRDAWVSNWYHTVSAVLLATRQYGELRAHFARAEVVLPNDPLALFDRACAAEATGLPAAQQVRATGTTVALNFQRRPIETIVATAGSSNADAERLFRRALEIDPNLVEARVRLARLLSVHDKPEESIRESDAALASLSKSRDDDDRLEFYAHLFASRSNRMLGRVAAALPHVEAALALFPDAQSALLEQSGVALMLADTAGAIAPVNRLSSVENPVTAGADPWWTYQLGAGRNVRKIVEQLRSAVR